MFGVIRPCRHRLGERLRTEWTAHLCGMCLALRDTHGQLARAVTNVDALVVSVLVDAQRRDRATRRVAGPCALRGMRRASVSTGDGARLAAATSLLLASTRLADNVADGDVRGPAAAATGAVAARWRRAGLTSADAIELDATSMLAVLDSQRLHEAQARSVLDATAPTELATASAFRQTAVLAGESGNAEPLAEAGALFGRLAHLLDAVQDRHDDLAHGAWNPLSAFGVGPAQARRLCEDALLGIRLALAEVRFDDDALVHALLVHELAAAVDRVFAEAGANRDATDWSAPPPRTRHHPVVGCLGWFVVCGTCQVCCAESYDDPCTGEQRSGACRNDCCSDRTCDGCGECCGECCCEAACACPC